MNTTIQPAGTSTMRFKCSRCGQTISADPQQLPTQCPNCQARLKPAKAMPMPVVVPPPPIVVQLPSEPFDFVEEKKADLRERREAREEDRRHYRDDRQANMLGLAGFAMTITMMLVLASGWLFAKSLPAYLYITASLAVPVSIAGLIMCVVASCMPNRQRLLAMTGAAVGAVVVLFMLPMSFMLREILGQ